MWSGIRKGGPAVGRSAGRPAESAAASARGPAAGRSRTSPQRLLAAVLALALAFGLCAAAHAQGVSRLSDTAAPRSSATGGSAIGVLLDSRPPDGGGDLVANGSYLGVLLATAASEDVKVTFLLEKPAEGAEERVYHTEVIGRGEAVPRPPDPVWPKEPGDADDFAFDVWCDEAGAAYDFATPVTEDTTLHAAWIKKDPDRKKVSVTFKGCGGKMPDPNDAGQTVEEYTVGDLPTGSHYPLPADPARTGYVFRGWFTAEEGGAEVTGADVLGETDVVLYARWRAVSYRVCYHENHGSAPLSWTDPHDVVYDATDVAFADWEKVRAEGGFTKPDGKDLDGWCTTKDGTGGKYKPGDPVANLTATDGRVVDLYALWKKAGTVEDGPFDVAFHFNDGTGRTHVVEDVDKFGTVPEEDPVKAPKRTGYQFGGWFADEELTAPWTFADQIVADTELWAKWDLRLDVTVPVSVGFAVDADTGEAAGPAADAYAVKSRTVRPVQVEAFELASERAELEAFFEPSEGAGWDEGVAETRLSLRSERAADGIELSLAGERRPLTAAERAEYSLGAFDYGVLGDDEAWQGADPCQRLQVAFGLSVSGKLKAKTGQAGPVPIAHLKVTVSAQG